ncbi:TPA: autotransporter outer membrane beta-barrel domain-containing protein [Yersinia enterocolitica]
MRIHPLARVVGPLSLLLTHSAFAAVVTIDGGDIITVPGTQISPWNIGDQLQVGDGTLTISEGGVVSNTNSYLAYSAGSTGIINVSGAGATWKNTSSTRIGDLGHGTLMISDGGTVTGTASYLAYSAGSTGIVNVSGTGSKWTNSSLLYVGYSGNGVLTITDGGTVSNTEGYIGANNSDGSGLVNVAGAGSTWTNQSYLYVGRTGGEGVLSISDGGTVTSRDAFIGVNNGTGRASVAGVGSTLAMSSNLHVGYGGNGTLTISDGGRVSSIDSTIGYSGTGVVNVSGIGSQWNNSSTLLIGQSSGNGTLTIADEAIVSTSSLTITSNSTGKGTLNIGNGNLAGTLNAARITGGVGSATVNFNHTDDIDFTPQMSGTLTVNKINNGMTTLTAVNNYVGVTTVGAGVLQAGASGAFSSDSDFVVGSGGALNLAGYEQTLKSLNNTGMVSFNGAMLTVSGDYIGNSGLLNFNTVLDGDTSATDKLVINGNTSGTTGVNVSNLGGSGAATLNGIELIQVNGVSDGEFVQNGRIVAGAYDYSLVRGASTNASNWYLTSVANQVVPEPNPNPEPGQEPPIMVERPEAGGYTANLAAANNMFVTRLHDRLGETQYIDALTGEKKVTSLWLRNEGGHNRSRDSQEQLGTQSNRYVLQLGGDIAQWSHNERDRFHLGIMAGYGNSKSKTESRLSGYSARASVDGYSTGVYGTWYANDTDKSGWYVDSWAQYSWFNNTVNGQNLGTEEYQSHGVTASVESGYTFNIGENTAKNAQYFIQPKAQVTWMGVKADDHKEANGTHISGEGDGNIQTRLGVKVFMSGYAEQDKGKDRVFQPFIEANWIHNTKDFGTNMDGMTVKQDGAANIAELKMGIEGQINKQVNLWGNVGQQIGNKGYSDTAAMLGVKYNF